jgi:hypothetical protein
VRVRIAINEVGVKEADAVEQENQRAQVRGGEDE